MPVKPLLASPKSASEGFSLLELAVVVAVLSIISALTIPAISKWIALAKIDSVKTLLNSAASECLQDVREGNDPQSTSPSQSTISNDNLGSHGYQIKSTDSTCSSFLAIPTAENDSFLYQLGFKLSANGDIVKIAVPASDSGSLNSCKNWAGVNCGVSADQQAIWDALAKIEKDKKACNDNFYTWLQKPSTGSYSRWDETTKSCSLETWAFEGSTQKDEAAVKSARAAKIGAACTAKLKEKETAKFDGAFTDPECGTTYFCSGKDLATDSRTAYLACKEEELQTRCSAALNTWKSQSINGKFDESGCTAQWKCNGTIYSSETDYNNSACGYVCSMQQVQTGTRQETVTTTTRQCRSQLIGRSMVNTCQDVPSTETRTVPVYEMKNVCAKR
jgi:prepilin-type N-terminal cleavage/methylation domain-containing protein